MSFFFVNSFFRIVFYLYKLYNMAVNVLSPAFKFASIRNPKPMELPPDIISVMPDTPLILSLVAINESNSTTAQKLSDTNALLQDYIDSSDFIKTTTSFYSIVDINTPTDAGLKLMYDNLIVRLLTKSNTNEVYGLLLKYIKKFAANLNSTTEDKVRIVIPEKITFPFTEFEGENNYTPPTDESAIIIGNIIKYTEVKNKINEAKENNIVGIAPNNKVSKRNTTFLPLLQYFGKSKIIVSDANTFINNKITTLTTRSQNSHDFPQTDSALSVNTSLRTTEDNNEIKVFNEAEHIVQLKKLVQLAIDQNLTEINENEIETDASYNVILSVLEVTRITIEAAEKKTDEKLKELYKKADKLVPGKTYSLIGKEWKDITPIVNPGYVVQDETGTSIMVHTHGCYLKYPVQVADLRVIEQQTVGYIPAEIAHINNTQRGEKNTRVTRRLKKVESFESLIQENEVTKETDVQSTERFSIENEAYQVQQEENSWNVNASVSGSYGPVSIWQGKQGYILNVEVHCDLTTEALNEWQTKAYYDLLDAYDKLKAQADAKLNEFDPNAPGLPPEKKRDVIRTELKKEAIRKMFRCNPFWVNDKYQVGKEYYPNCCLDSSNAERVRFLETVFDWRNMTYELHPYFYANKTQWNKILDLEDDDPHFEAFLKASFVTIHIPVHRDNLKEIAACNFIVNNAIGNYETIPQGLESLIEELDKEKASEFTVDLDGNPIPASTSVDLGIFPIPTGLVILECSNQDGVKPIGFPQTAPGVTNVSIPKQYSPAIIADNCDNP